jgi:prepilin-type processing-associated H-X9-DG protein
MNPRPCSGRRSGITLLEVMILMAVMAVIALLVLPMLARSQVRSSRINCINNVKQLGLSFRQWAMDYGDRLPMAVPMEQGGTKDHPLAHEAWVHFWVLSNEINTPKVLVCPEDKQRSAREEFTASGSLKNVSYFVSLDAEHDQQRLLLVGDRNLTANGKAVTTGIHVVNPNTVPGWTKAIHNQHGNVGFADGSAQKLSSAALQQYLIDNPQTNRLAIP